MGAVIVWCSGASSALVRLFMRLSTIPRKGQPFCETCLALIYTLLFTSLIRDGRLRVSWHILCLSFKFFFLFSSFIRLLYYRHSCAVTKSILDDNSSEYFTRPGLKPIVNTASPRPPLNPLLCDSSPAGRASSGATTARPGACVRARTPVVPGSLWIARGSSFMRPDFLPPRRRRSPSMAANFPVHGATAAVRPFARLPPSRPRSRGPVVSVTTVERDLPGVTVCGSVYWSDPRVAKSVQRVVGCF